MRLTRALVLVGVLLLCAPGGAALAVGNDSDKPVNDRGVSVGGSRTVLSTTFEQQGGTDMSTERGQGHGRIGYGARGPSTGDGGAAAGQILCGVSSMILDTQWQALPTVLIRTSPHQEGVVNVDTYFWIDGGSNFNGQRWMRVAHAHQDQTTPIHDAQGNVIGCAPAPPIPHDVQLYYWPIHYDWDYGDDTPHQSIDCGSDQEVGDCTIAVGSPDPRIVHHTYEVGSAFQPHADPNGYLVVVNITFAVAMGIDGGTPLPMQVLPPNPVWMHLPVREIESVLTN